MPAAETSLDVVMSHPGATYGGLIPAYPIGQSEVVEIFNLLVTKLQESNYKSLIYKPTPHVFHKQIWENDIYALHKIGINSMSVQPNSVLDLSKVSLGRKKNRRKALSHGCATKQVENAGPFFELLTNWLEVRHRTRPVHSLQEIQGLQLKFPDFIILETRIGNKLVAGSMLLRINGVIHIQYLASSPEGLETQALDNLIEFISYNIERNSQIISFGSSSDKSGKNLNEGLVSFKEGFGCTTHVLQEFCIDL
jgi:hypothetical protein